ncbi:uncharacterized protein [Penaeus vannamei]|uniref:uncharacterized protein isoform X4 n=1 Tax=Penaeus vannamei TaxID=6689 RepID=UPI00387F49C4
MDILLFAIVAVVVYVLFFRKKHPALPEGRGIGHVIKHQVNGIPALDLQGMGARRALDWTDYFLRKHGHGLTRIITGRGLHSLGAKPVLREVVMDYCRKNGYSFNVGDKGYLEVSVRN